MVNLALLDDLVLAGMSVAKHRSGGDKRRKKKLGVVEKRILGFALDPKTSTVYRDGKPVGKFVKRAKNAYC
jgi:hypothetical protein